MGSSRWWFVAASVMLMGVLSGCCTKEPDRGVFLNKKGETALEDAKRLASLGDLGEARKQLAEAKAAFNTSLKVTRSPYVKQRARLYTEDIRALENKIALVEAQAKAADEKRRAEDEAARGKWGKKPEAADAPPSAAGTPKRTVDLAEEELEAKRRKARREGGGDISELEKYAPTPLTGEKGDTIHVAAESAVSADPVVVTKIEHRGKNVLVHGVFNNKGKGTVIVGVTAILRDANNGELDTCYQSYKEQGFSPNWDDIFNSKGEAITADSHMVPGGKSVRFVLVNSLDRARDVKKALVEVRLQDGRAFKASGPK